MGVGWSWETIAYSTGGGVAPAPKVTPLGTPAFRPQRPPAIEMHSWLSFGS